MELMQNSTEHGGKNAAAKLPDLSDPAALPWCLWKGITELHTQLSRQEMGDGHGSVSGDTPGRWERRSPWAAAARIEELIPECVPDQKKKLWVRSEMRESEGDKRWSCQFGDPQISNDLASNQKAIRALGLLPIRCFIRIIFLPLAMEISSLRDQHTASFPQVNLYL